MIFINDKIKLKDVIIYPFDNYCKATCDLIKDLLFANCILIAFILGSYLSVYLFPFILFN